MIKVEIVYKTRKKSFWSRIYNYFFPSKKTEMTFVRGEWKIGPEDFSP